MIMTILVGAVGAHILGATVEKPPVPLEENPLPGHPVAAPPPVNPIQTLFQFAPPTKQGVIRITRTNKQVEATKDPIWSVALVVNGEVKQELPALIGRANRQQLDRHIAGNKSPLPPGKYRIERAGIEMGPFSDPEVGRGYWVPITPLFQTGRSMLGLHQDPSWGLLNGESGTSGCVGFQSVSDTKEVVGWIKKYNISTMEVES